MNKYLLFVLLALTSSFAQLTVLNVPSADVTGKGQVYFRGDTTYQGSTALTTFTPNFMYGLGHDVEASLNLESFSHPGFGQVAITPGLKWRFLTPKNEGLFAYVGDKAYFPVHHKQYQAGNYLYGVTGLMVGGLRVGLGAYNSQNAVAYGNRTGAILTYEQTVKAKIDSSGMRALVTLAADWQSGHGANGVTTLGVMFFPSRRLMLIPAYQIYNANGFQGNNQAVVYVGYQLK